MNGTLDFWEPKPNCLTREKLLQISEFAKNGVVIMGGTNHRYGLYDMIMLKDNHIDYKRKLLPMQ